MRNFFSAERYSDLGVTRDRNASQRPTAKWWARLARADEIIRGYCARDRCKRTAVRWPRPPAGGWIVADAGEISAHGPSVADGWTVCYVYRLCYG